MLRFGIHQHGPRPHLSIRKMGTSIHGLLGRIHVAGHLWLQPQPHGSCALAHASTTYYSPSPQQHTVRLHACCLFSIHLPLHLAGPHLAVVSHPMADDGIGNVPNHLRSCVSCLSCLCLAAIDDGTDSALRPSPCGAFALISNLHFPFSCSSNASHLPLTSPFCVRGAQTLGMNDWLTCTFEHRIWKDKYGGLKKD